MQIYEIATRPDNKQKRGVKMPSLPAWDLKLIKIRANSNFSL